MRSTSNFLRAAAAIALWCAFGNSSSASSLFFTDNSNDWAASDPGAINGRFSAMLGGTYLDGFVSGAGGASGYAGPDPFSFLIRTQEGGATGISGSFEQLPGHSMERQSYLLTAIQMDGAVTNERIVNLSGQASFFGFTASGDPIETLRIERQDPSAVPEPESLILIGIGLAVLWIALARRGYPPDPPRDKKVDPTQGWFFD